MVFNIVLQHLNLATGSSSFHLQHHSINHHPSKITQYGAGQGSSPGVPPQEWKGCKLSGLSTTLSKQHRTILTRIQDTTVHESTNDAVQHEHVTRTQLNESQTAVDREVHQDVCIPIYMIELDQKAGWMLICYTASPHHCAARQGP